MKDNILGSLRLFLALTVLLGLAYPAVIWAIGQIAFRDAANGSLLRMEEGNGPAAPADATARVAGSALAVPPSPSKKSPGGRSGGFVGSSLIGQSFVMPGHFHGRPSAAGSGYDATATGGTNLGPTSKKLADSVKDAVTAVRTDEAVTGSVPADAVTSSASGLDPHISPDYARLQIPRVSRETKIAEADLEALVARQTEGRFLGLYGESRVNVLALNMAIDSKLGHPQIAPTPAPTPAPIPAPAPTS